MVVYNKVNIEFSMDIKKQGVVVMVIVWQHVHADILTAIVSRL